jgi:hypothetical protein
VIFLTYLNNIGFLMKGKLVKTKVFFDAAVADAGSTVM